MRFEEKKETRWESMLRVFGINPTHLVITALLLIATLILLVRACVLS
jgi:hypothetical protein